MSEFSESLPPPPGEPANRFARAHLILLYFIAAVIVIWLLSGIYQVRTNQVAIIERLGEFISNTDGQVVEYKSGLHYHLPWPIDQVHLVSTSEILTLKVSTFNSKPSAYADMKTDLKRIWGYDDSVLNALFDPYLITADKSIINMEIEATYRVNNPYLWLTSVSHESDVAGEPNDMRAHLFQQLAQRAMIHQTSHMTLDDALYAQRATVPHDLLETMRKDFEVLDTSDPNGVKTTDLGLEIQKVDVSVLKAPAAVQGAYDLVTNARQQLETSSRAGHTLADGLATTATADAINLKVAADTYKTRRKAEAQGEADQFTPVLETYHAAPEITRTRLLVDTMTTITSTAKQMIFARPGERTILTFPPPTFDPGQNQPNP